MIAWLPAASQIDRGQRLSFTERTNPKGVLHTTEGGNWPSYNGWTVNPHATVMPIPGRGVQIRQNIPFTHAAFALANRAGGAETNRDFALQFELVGTCNPDARRQFYYWPAADDAVLRDLFHKVMLPLSNAGVIPLVAPTFRAYPASYGSNGGRMSARAWDRFSGWCGHQHVPENDHGDPGAFPWRRMLALGGTGARYYRPVAGDDWTTIAEMYGRTLAELRALNGRSLPALVVGRGVRVQ